MIPGRTELLPAQSIFYVAFVDPSGGRRDQFTVAVAHRCGDKAIIDMIRAWKPPFDPSEVVKECAETLRPYRIRTIVGDAYGGEWPREQFRKHNIQYTVSALNRSQLYLNLIPTINSKRCELPADRRMIEELRRLGRRRGRTGKDSIDHPAHLSDDLANSTAGAIDLVITKAPMNKNAVPLGLDVGLAPSCVRPSGHWRWTNHSRINVWSRSRGGTAEYGLRDTSSKPF